MSNDFSELLGNDDDLDDSPSWIEETTEEDDAFDAIRRRQARASSAMDGLEDDFDDETLQTGTSRSSGGGLGSKSAGQRLILVLLLILNIAALAFGILVLTGSFTL
mgnify:CR=1 FL=1